MFRSAARPAGAGPAPRSRRTRVASLEAAYGIRIGVAVPGYSVAQGGGACVSRLVAAGALLVLPGEGTISEHGLGCLACLRQSCGGNHGIKSIGEGLRDPKSNE